MDWVTTSILISRLTKGDDDAWVTFVDRFKPPILALGRRVGLDPASAEDAAQETLLVLVTGLRDGAYVREKGKLSNWVFGIARFKALKALEKVGRRGESLDQSQAPEPIDERALETYWEGSWAGNLLERSLIAIRGEVEPKTLAAFEGTVLARESAEAVAARLGMTPNAVTIAKHRVLKRLRQLKDEFENV